MDAEYFSKEAIIVEEKIKSKEHFFIENKNVVSGPFGSTLKSSEYLEKGDIPFVRIENIKGGFSINTSNLVYISNENNDRIKNSQLSLDDLILSKVGNSIGFYARVGSDIGTCNISENNIGIKLKDFKTEEKHTIMTYLNSLYGQILLLRRKSGNAQPKLNVNDVCFIPIPKLSDVFSKKISDLIIYSERQDKQSQSLLFQAENLLISELGLENFNPSREKVSIRTLKESFLRTGRIDSEYYQPKYDDYLKKVFSYCNGYELLGECCNIKDNNFVPKDDEEYRYIELANVRNNAQISDCDVLIGKELPTRARRKVNTGDVIVSSIEGSLESCALITEEYNNSLCSTGFYVVNSEKLNAESLLTAFKSSLMLNLMKKGCSGTILTNISKEEFAKLPIPLLKQGVQDEIASYIKQSMEYSKKAKKLLEISTKSVEIAINKDEQTAQNFLDRQTDRQTDSQTDRQTDRQIDRQTDRQTDRQDTNCLL